MGCSGRGSNAAEDGVQWNKVHLERGLQREIAMQTFTKMNYYAIALCQSPKLQLKEGVAERTPIFNCNFDDRHKSNAIHSFIIAE